jgi:hypothetical protein
MPDVQGWFQESALAEAWGCIIIIQQSEGCEAPFAQDFLKVHFFRSGPRSECIVSLAWSQMDLVIMNQNDISEIHLEFIQINAQRAWLRGLNGLWVWNCRGDWVHISPFSSLRSSRKLLWNSIQTTLCLLYQDNPSIHGHRTLKAPHPVWSAQLTRVPPS